MTKLERIFVRIFIAGALLMCVMVLLSDIRWGHSYGWW